MEIHYDMKGKWAGRYCINCYSEVEEIPVTTERGKLDFLYKCRVCDVWLGENQLLTARERPNLLDDFFSSSS